MLEISSYFFHYTSPRQNLTDEAKNPIFKSILCKLYVNGIEFSVSKYIISLIFIIFGLFGHIKPKVL